MLFGESDKETGRGLAGIRKARNRYLPMWRVRPGLIRGLLTLAGVAAQFVGRGSAPTEHSGLWHDGGLLALLLAVSLPLWRRSDRQRFEARQWLGIARRATWRAGVLFLAGADLCLILYRYLMIGNDSSPADAASAVGQVLLIPAAVALSAGSVLSVRARRRGPSAMSRDQRTEKLLDVLDASEVAAATRPAHLRASADRTALRGKDWNKFTDFDPDRGASGRLRPVRQVEAGGGPDRHARKVIQTYQARISWNSENVTVKPRRDRTVLQFPVVAGPTEELVQEGPRPWAVAEIVVFTTFSPVDNSGRPFLRTDDSLLFLDDEGYCLYLQTGIMPEWSDLVELAGLAGVPCSAYTVNCRLPDRPRIRKLMFPPRPDSQGRGKTT